MGRLVAAITLTAALAACGEGGGGAPAAPPPPNPLSWNDVPESVELDVGEQKTQSLLLTSAVAATYSHSASNANVSIAAESPRTGVYAITLTGVEPGDSTVTVTATAPGYATATGTFPVKVNLRPLSWSEIPDSATVAVGETEEISLGLSAPILADLRVETSNSNITASGECSSGTVLAFCLISVTGIEVGESSVRVTATAEGYTEAVGEIDITIEEPFDTSLWRELVFDAYDCPSGDTSELCLDRWGNRQVQDRITVILSSQPNFNLLVGQNRRWRFSSSQERTVRNAIRDAVEQVTGERFRGRITTSESFVDRNGWVDVAPAREELWTDQGFSAPCGVAWPGATEGFIIINLDALGDCDLYSLMLHEVGHSLGLFHVLNLGDYIMSPFLTDIPPVFSEGEQFMAQLAWDLGRGVRYTPDPRRGFSSGQITRAAPARRGIRTLWDLPLGDMVQCRMRD